MLIHPVKTQTTISISTQTLLMRLWTGKTYKLFFIFFLLFCVLLTVLDSYISLLFTNQVCTVLYQTTDVG